MTRALLLAALVALAPAALAQQPPAPACATKDSGLPAHLAAWTRKGVVAPASAAAGLPASAIVPGKAYATKLHAASAVAFAAAPERAPAANTHAGVFALRIEQAGTYGVALGSPGWVDIVKGGAALTSTTHGHGPECSSIRKIVNYTLEPGDYVVQVSGNAEPALDIMVLRQP